MLETSGGLTAAAVVLIGVWMLGVTRIAANLQFYSVQTLLLGGLAMWEGLHLGEPALVVIGAAFLGLKGLVIPIWLSRVIVRIGCRRDEGLAIAPPLLMVLAVGLLAGLFLDEPLRALLPSSTMPALGLLLVGMLLMMTRRTAISQIIGFLVLENGIFLYTVSQGHAMPVLVELGALLDILGWTMMAGVLTFHINDSFEHIDVSTMKELQG